MTPVYQKARFDLAVPVFSLWHGGHAWSGAPQNRARPKGKCENGPGIDLTTDLSTAIKYARGGGSVLRFVIAQPRKWLDDVEATIPLCDALAFYQELRRVPNRGKILEDLRWNAERLNRPVVSAASLVNLGVNHEAFTGENGPELCRRLVEWGVDASCTRRHGDEYWVNLFNPDLVVRVEKTLASDERCEAFPQPAIQLAANRQLMDEMRALMQLSLDCQVRQNPAMCGLEPEAVPLDTLEGAQALSRIDELFQYLGLGAKTAWRQFLAQELEGVVRCSAAGVTLLGAMKGITCIGASDDALNTRRVMMTPLGQAALKLFPADFVLAVNTRPDQGCDRYCVQATTPELA